MQSSKWCDERTGGTEVLCALSCHGDSPACDRHRLLPVSERHQQEGGIKAAPSAGRR